jgi:hypothetical protein
MQATKTAASALTLDFDPEVAEEKALVRVRQASVGAPGGFYALRSGGAMFEAIAIGIAVLAAAWGAFTLTGGSGDILGSPRLAVVAAGVGGALLIALLLAVAGQLLVAQAAVARSTRLLTAIVADLNHTVTATVAAGHRGTLAHAPHDGQVIPMASTPPPPPPAAASA